MAGSEMSKEAHLEEGKMPIPGGSIVLFTSKLGSRLVLGRIGGVGPGGGTLEVNSAMWFRERELLSR